TMEVLGILPIPESICVGSAMQPHDAAFDQCQKHSFLDRVQGTHKPILPIHTSTEKKLFHDLMNSNSAFSSISGEPWWEIAVKDWNLRADGIDDISYKLIEQLKAYYTKWKSISHIKETLSLSAEVRGPLSLIIHDPSCSTKAPTVPYQPLCPHSISQGLL
ncbi:hypothetical protein CPB84DRAFT_1667887, partial [Gymnopilus junonius]